MDARDVGLERLVAVAREVVRQEVIEEDVGDDARVVAVVGDEDAAEGGHARMAVGERVDSPMLANPLGDRIAASDRSFHEVAREAADHRFRAVAAEEEVREVVHFEIAGA